MRRRGERVIAADMAKPEAAKAGGCEGAGPDIAPMKLVFGAPQWTQQQVKAAAAVYQANYADYTEEIAALMEARLAASLKADGCTVSPMPAADRLKVLRRRVARRN